MKYLIQSSIISAIYFILSYITLFNISNKTFAELIGLTILVFFNAWISQKIIQKELFSKHYFIGFIVGISWLVFPFLIIKDATVNLHHVNDFNQIYDVLTSVTFIFLLALIQNIFCTKTNSKITSYLFSFMCATIILFGPILNCFHDIAYGVGITNEAIMEVVRTNIKESIEYLFTAFDLSHILTVIIGYFLFIIFVSRIVNKITKEYNSRVLQDTKSNKKLELGFLAFLFLFFCFIPLNNSFLGDTIRFAQDTKIKEKAFLDSTKNIYENSLQLSALSAIDYPNTVVLIIGESATRDKMHVYHRDYQYENTPWLEKQIDTNKNFILFDNVYAPYNCTVEALEQVLTNSSQYNNIKFENALSILDLFKKAGYKTYWISNQIGATDVGQPLTILSNRADYIFFPKETHYYINEHRYDEVLLEKLKEIDFHKDEKKFILLHLSGSHFKYDYRYPPQYEKFHPNQNIEEYSLENKEILYSNSIFYTDSNLEKIFNWMNGNSNLETDIFIYLSDHGENMEKQHHPSIKTGDTIRIPMFIYLSDKFLDKNKSLVENKNKYFSSDMLFNTISGIAKLKSNYYLESEDLSSEKYNFKKNDIKTFHGTMKINELK